MRKVLQPSFAGWSKAPPSVEAIGNDGCVLRKPNLWLGCSMTLPKGQPEVEWQALALFPSYRPPNLLPAFPVKMAAKPAPSKG